MELNSSLNKRTRRILLVIYGCDIFKIDSGGALRNTLFAKALSEIGHVDVICFSRDDAVSNIPNCNILFSRRMYEHNNLIDSVRTLIDPFFCPSSPSSYYKVSKKKSAIVSDFVKRGKYDIIASRYVESSIECGLLKYKDKLVIDADDNPASVLRYKAVQANSIIEKWKKRYQSKRVGQMTEKFLDSVRCSFYSNPLEKPSKLSVFLHNTTTMTQSAPDITEDICPRILFVGSLYFFPNKQGITHFAELIFPQIKRAYPLVELYIVGKGDSDFLAYLNGMEGVKAVGRVDDLASEYQKATVVVIPIYYGSGTSVKFVEAMLMNRPVVSSPIGARGFNELCQDGVHYILANNDEEFVIKTIGLLSSIQKSKEIAKHGCEIANKHFSQKRFIEIVKENILK